MSTTPLLAVLACGLVTRCLLLIPMVPGGRIDTRDFSALPRRQHRGFNVLLTTLGIATLATARMAVARLAVAAWPALLVALVFVAVFAADLGGIFPVVEDALPVQLLVLEALSLALAGVGAGLVHYHAGSVAALREAIAELLRRYRAGLAEQLRTAGLAEPEATAALLTALVDGALLQRSLDPRLDLEPVVALLSTQLRAVRRDL